MVHGWRDQTVHIREVFDWTPYDGPVSVGWWHPWPGYAVGEWREPWAPTEEAVTEISREPP